MSTLLGTPYKGIHAARLCGLAFWDLAFTLIAAVIWTHFGGPGLLKTFVVLFGAGVACHLAFGVDTGFLKLFHS